MEPLKKLLKCITILRAKVNFGDCMFPLFRRKKNIPIKELIVIDLTVGASLADDYYLPDFLEEKLLCRDLRKDVTIEKANILIDEWEDEYSIANIRFAYNSQEWEVVFKLTKGRIAVYSEVEPHIHLIRAHYTNQNWIDCSFTCEDLLKLDGNNLDGLRFIARCAKNMSDDPKSEIFYNKILDILSEDADSLLSLIRINYNKSAHEKVIELATKIIEFHPEIRDGHLFMSRSKMVIDDFEGSIEPLKQLLKIDRNDLEALLGIGKSLFAIGDYKKAAKHLKNALKIDPKERRARRTLALVLDHQRDWSGAEKLFEIECNYFPEMYSNWEKRINLLYRMNNEKKAKKCIKDILELMDNGLEAYLLANSVASSFYWEEEAAELLNYATNKWGHLINFHSSIIKYAIDNGLLSRALIHIKKATTIDEGNSEIEALTLRFNTILRQTRTPESLVEQSIEDNEELLHSECAIINISEGTKNVDIRRSATKEKSVIMISSSLGRGGAERQVVSCLDGLKRETVFNDINLFCYSLDNSGGALQTYEPEIRKIGVEIHEFGRRLNWNADYENADELLQPWTNYLDHIPQRMRREIEPLFLAFSKYKPDIVHAWQDQTNINVAIAGLMAGVPGIVLFARSLRPDGKTMMHMRNRPYLKMAYQALLKHDRIILCQNSSAGAESYAEWLDIDSSQFEVIHNGVDFDSLIEASKGADISEELKKYGISKDSKVIGSVFRFVQEKQPKLWVDAVAKVIENNHDVHGLIIGGGGLLKTIEQYIAEKGLGDRIHLVGQTRQVKAWLDVFDLFLLTSKVEGLPNVLLEAQAFGVPVISTDAGGAKDTFIDGETGVLIPKGDEEKLASILEDKLMDKEWISRARKSSKEYVRGKFSQEAMIKTLIEIYYKSVK